MRKHENDNLYYNDCRQCGNMATSVIDTENNLRKGWYCEHCTHFEPAIGRERVWIKDAIEVKKCV